MKSNFHPPFQAISWMKWIDEFCPDLPYLVKSDDDILIDPFKLRDYLHKTHSVQEWREHRKFHCYYWRYGHIDRRESSKWFVSRKQFPGRRFPSYCSGSAFILSAGMSKVLLEEFRRDPTFLWIDDVFLTGILAKRAGVKQHSISSRYALEVDGIKKRFEKNRLLFAHISGAANHGVRTEYWTRILEIHGVSLTEEGWTQKYANCTIYCP